MGDFITAATVKDNFPLWETYCTRADGLKNQDEMLDIAIDNAETELAGYLSTTFAAADMTDFLSLQLLKIVKKYCFDFKHGDSQFDKKPNIVREYERAIGLLENGIITANGVTLASKERHFDKFFNDNDYEWYES